MMRTRIAKPQTVSQAARSRCSWGHLFEAAPLRQVEGTKPYANTLVADDGGPPGG